VTDVADLQRQARALLPADIYDYYAGGAGREATLRANVKAWRRCWLLPRVLRDVSAVDTGVDLPGLARSRLSTPVAVAPVAFQGLARPEGEVATATGAARAGALFALSTRSSRRLEDVAAAVAAAGGEWWFQVYVMRDRLLTTRLVRRAAAAGASALVLTVDTPEVGSKRRNRSDGVISQAQFLAALGPDADPAAAEQAADLTLADIGWLSEAGGGLPVLVKGVLRADDAQACVAAGAAGVIVSNHGGRQLDRAMPTALALPRVAAALAGQADGGTPPVFVDGGIRTAEDVLTALALGARAVFVGRPALWALAAGGSQGVQDLLRSLTAGLRHVMALAGITAPAQAAGLAAAGQDSGAWSRAGTPADQW
jgi:4-hydroxymandelate oxidase